MKKTQWDLCPEMKTSSMLLAPTLEQHYAIMSKYFQETDKILDVGCGSGTFSDFISNSKGVDENTDLLSFDLSNFNTLHFSESIGYLDKTVLTKLISSPFIKKIIIKDFIYLQEEFLDTTYWSYDLRTLYRIVLPLLQINDFKTAIKPFIPYRERWLNIVKKYNLDLSQVTGEKYKLVQNVLVIAKK